MENFYTHTFSLRHHWWFDAGLSGLFYIAAYVKDNDQAFNSVTCAAGVRDLTLKAPSQEVLKNFLESCYNELVNRYWNVSTKKQKEDNEIVIYDYVKGEFGLAPRVAPTPIPKLFTKGSSYRINGEEYKNLSEEMQHKVDAFLEKHNKTLWGNKKILAYESPVCHQQIELFPNKGSKTICSVCGQKSICKDVSQTSFLLFAGSSATLSFNSEGKKPDKICWECDLLGKFAIESAHYKFSDDNLYILQMASSSVEKLINHQAILGSQSAVRLLDEDNYYSNIGTYKEDNRLLYYARLPYELLFAFFYDTYDLLQQESKTRGDSAQDLDMFCVKTFIEAPLQLILQVIFPKGQTFSLNEVIAYTETAYAFRLIHAAQKEFPLDYQFLFKIFRNLYLPVRKDRPFDKNNYLWRNRILQLVLQKKPIVQQMEWLVFRKSSLQELPYLGDLLDFTRFYEFIIRGGSDMTKEQVEVAVKLGRQIVIAAQGATKNDASSSFDRVKGDLFALRKTRTKSDFLEQLNRIQFRYGITVSNQILDGILEEPNISFADFKSYCLIAALSHYNLIKSKKHQESTAN